MEYSCTRRLAAEVIGSTFLLAVVVGSGIMGSRLSAGVDALILLPHALAVGGVLFVMIKALGPISGGHFNPAVTLAFLVLKKLSPTEAGLYVLAQLVGGVLGVWATHYAFGESILQLSTTDRGGLNLMVEEFLVTIGLVGIVLVMVRRGADAVAVSIGAYVALAIWSSASTGFANPGVTISRILTDTVTGIDAASAAGFVVAQLLAGVAAAYGVGWLLTTRAESSGPSG